MTASRTILVIEDDFDVRDALTDILTDAGYQVVCAREGEEALERLKTEPAPALIILDLMMPGMDGFQFRAEQRKNPGIADIPVVVLSADSRVDRWRDLGASDYVRKPVNLEELLATVGRYC